MTVSLLRKVAPDATYKPLCRTTKLYRRWQIYFEAALPPAILDVYNHISTPENILSFILHHSEHMGVSSTQPIRTNVGFVTGWLNAQGFLHESLESDATSR